MPNVGIYLGKRVIFICVAVQHTLGYNMLDYKSCIVSNPGCLMNKGKQRSCRNFLHLNTSLAQDYVIATAIQILGHIIYDLLNLVASSLCTFTDYF